jgi:hypothetical protein
MARSVRSFHLATPSVFEVTIPIADEQFRLAFTFRANNENNYPAG